MASLPLPRGFRAHVTNIGVKDQTDDFTVVAADTVCAAAGVFTQSSFAGASVLLSRRNVADLRARAMVVVSKKRVRCTCLYGAGATLRR